MEVVGRDGAVTVVESSQINGLTRCRTVLSVRAVTAITAIFVLSFAVTATALASDKVFTVGNYPVEAQAANAVAAKAKALEEGRNAALRSLVKRLVPVSSYGRLNGLNLDSPESLLSSIRVRSERNSTTTYIASLDFMFQSDAVRLMLDRLGLPYVDRPAPEVVLVPVWQGDETLAGQAGEAWLQAWRNVDVEHSVAPLRIMTKNNATHADTVAALAKGDARMLRTFASDYGGPDLMLAAIATPEPAQQQVQVRLIGRDGAGPISWSRNYKLEDGDGAYTLELAAVVSLGVLEGRWKALALQGSASPGAAGLPTTGATGLPAGASPWETTTSVAGVSGPTIGVQGGSSVSSSGDNIQFAVEFEGMGAWQDISRRLAQVPGLQELDVLGLGNRSARLTGVYAGGIERLAEVLPNHGLVLRRGPRGWVVNSPQ